MSITGGNYKADLIGVTQLAVGLSATLEVNMPAYTWDAKFRVLSGGTLALVNGASAISTSGYAILSGAEFETYGASKFYLAAAGATAVVQVVFFKSPGSSFVP